MVCTNSENFTKWKVAILQLCRKSTICNFKVIDGVESFAARLDKAKERSHGKRHNARR